MDFYPKFADCFERVIPRMRETVSKLCRNCVQAMSKRCPSNVEKLMNMKRTAIFALTAATLLVCGCDFFRGLAGRPTSAEIAEKRVAVEAVKAEAAAREQARLDSLRIVEEAAADSLAALSKLETLNVKVLAVSEIGAVYGDLGKGYSVVVGSFKSVANAERMAAKVADEGYASSVLRFSNGMAAVVVEPRTKIADAVRVYEKVKSEKFCPDDAWILSNN